MRLQTKPYRATSKVYEKFKEWLSEFSMSSGENCFELPIKNFWDQARVAYGIRQEWGFLRSGKIRQFYFWDQARKKKKISGIRQEWD